MADFTLYDASKVKSHQSSVTNKIRKSNFELGTDRSTYHQTTQQFNNTFRNRCMSARSSLGNAQTMNRSTLNRTQFKLGFQRPSVSSFEPKKPMCDENNAGEMSKHKILSKGKGTNNNHNYVLGNTKLDYKSSNIDSYQKFDIVSKNPGSEIIYASKISNLTEQQKKNIKILNQHKNMLEVAKANAHLGNSQLQYVLALY